MQHEPHALQLSVSSDRLPRLLDYNFCWKVEIMGKLALKSNAKAQLQPILRCHRKSFWCASGTNLVLPRERPPHNTDKKEGEGSPSVDAALRSSRAPCTLHVMQIQERREFLEAMRAAGRAKEHEQSIRAEIQVGWVRRGLPGTKIAAAQLHACIFCLLYQTGRSQWSSSQA